MKSKTSFFNRTVFKKNVTLYWPIWVCYLLYGMVKVPGQLWSRLQQQTDMTAYARDYALYNSLRLEVDVARNCNYGSRLWDGFVWLSVYPEECVYDPCTAGYKGGTVCDEYDQWPLFSIDSAGTGFSGNGGSLSFERHCECAVSGIVVFKCYGNCFFPLCNGVFLCHVYRTAVCTSGVLSGG